MNYSSLYLSRHLSFHLIIVYIDIKLFIIFPYCPFITWKICSDITSLVSDTGNLGLFSPFFACSVWLAVYQFYWWSQIISFWFHLFSLFFCLFLFVYFLALFPFFCLLLASICSFTSFLRWKLRSLILDHFSWLI